MTSDREPIFHNSIQIVGRDGLLRERYDKHHLVPFGEYLPFRSILDRSARPSSFRRRGGSPPATGAPALLAPGLPPATPLICYEAIFPVEVGDAFSRARRSGLAAERHGRRLVRDNARPLSALRPGAAEGDRAGAAARAGRQFRHIGGCRRIGPRASPRRRSALRPCLTLRSRGARPRLGNPDSGPRRRRRSAWRSCSRRRLDGSAASGTQIVFLALARRACILYFR